VQHENAKKAAEYVCYDQPKAWFDKNPGQTRKIALFAHGGLNSLSAGLARASVMAPYFTANGIWPVFAVWQSGFADTIGNAMSDHFDREIAKQGPAGGILKNLAEAVSERFDGFLEASIARLIGKPLWSEMKENARLASSKDGALEILAESIKRFKKEKEEIEVHLIGHSAGAVMLGEFIGLLKDAKIKPATCSLYAPACTLSFAARTFGAALQAGDISPKNFSLDILSDERERADSVTAYGKSLLYLISRALERDSATPILGMEAVFNGKLDEKRVFNNLELSPSSSLLQWRNLWDGLTGSPQPKVWGKEKLSDGEGLIDVNHGCFDNSVEVVRATLERIRGGKLVKPVKSLRFG
jgi:pimeloyl-ACP methyl ester carboxylesterase